MSYAGTSEIRLYDGFSRLGQVALAGPGVGALLLGAVVFVNEANFRLGDVHQFSFDWQIILRLLVCALCGAYGLAHLRQTGDTLLRFPGAWGLLFALWAVVTVAFGINPTYATATTGCLWCIILFVPAVMRQIGGQRIVFVVLAALSTYMVLSWVAYFAYPELARTQFILPTLEVVERFGGLNHANSTGRQAALGIGLLLVLGCERVARWQKLAPFLGGFAICLYFTNSRTSMAATAAVALLCVFRYGTSRMRAALLMAVPAVAVLVGIALSSGLVKAEKVLSSLSRSGEAEELYSLTGRLGVWEVVMESVSERPLAGFGHGSSRFVMARFNEDYEQDVAGYHAHNLLLNVILGSGLIGGMLLLAMFASQTIGFLTRPEIFPDVILVLVTVGGIADAVMLNPIPDSHTVLWFIALFWRQMGASLSATSRGTAWEVAPT